MPTDHSLLNKSAFGARAAGCQPGEAGAFDRACWVRWASWAVVRLPCARGSQQARQWKVNSAGGQECVSHRALLAARAHECGSGAFTGTQTEPLDLLSYGGVGAGGGSLSSRGPPHAAARGSGMEAVFTAFRLGRYTVDLEMCNVVPYSVTCALAPPTSSRTYYSIY